MDGWIYDEIQGGSKQDFGRASSGVSWRRAPAMHVLHSTEGSSWPGYKDGGNAPHITINARARQLRQHFSLNAGARALLPGGVAANNMGTVQYEIIGSCSPALIDLGYPSVLNFDDGDLGYIAQALKLVSSRTGIPLTSSVPFMEYPRSYGARAGNRLSAAQFNSYSGVLGHQHIPGNLHGDPGSFNIGRLLELAGGAVITPPTPKPPTGGGTDDIMSKLPTLDWSKPKSTKQGDAHGRLQGLLAASGEYTGKMDDIPGPLSHSALGRFQVRYNCGDGRGGADYVAGDKTWESALLGKKW